MESQSLLSIAEIMNISDRYKFKNKYLNPLIEDSLLAMTAPDKPNSKTQRYYTTEKGKALLEQLK
jgi:ATP-dependent DNA helicase RecG